VVLLPVYDQLSGDCKPKSGDEMMPLLSSCGSFFVLLSAPTVMENACRRNSFDPAATGANFCKLTPPVSNDYSYYENPRSDNGVKTAKPTPRPMVPSLTAKGKYVKDQWVTIMNKISWNSRPRPHFRCQDNKNNKISIAPLRSRIQRRCGSRAGRCHAKIFIKKKHELGKPCMVYPIKYYAYS